MYSSTSTITLLFGPIYLSTITQKAQVHNMITSPLCGSKIVFFCTGGNHGFSNDFKSMHPFFIAHGPVFKRGYISEPFNSVDVYPLICKILNIQPAPNNGSLDNIQHILKLIEHKHGPRQLFGFTVTAVTCAYCL